MALLRIAAFSDGLTGGNPAGVSIGATLPPPETMQRIAAEVGYSETAFAAPEGGAWRVRYFSPQTEVPFCGHALIEQLSGISTQVIDPALDFMKAQQPNAAFQAFQRQLLQQQAVAAGF